MTDIGIGSVSLSSLYYLVQLYSVKEYGSFSDQGFDVCVGFVTHLTETKLLKDVLKH